jgi:iron(III) transport system substrate-binding protein
MEDQRMATPALLRSTRRNGRPVLAGSVLAVSLALAACGDSPAPASGEAAETGPPAAVSEADWDELVDAAEAEGEVVVYSSLSGVEVTFEEFKRAYPGINVTIERAPTGDLITRLDQEIAVNAQGADVTLHSQTGWFEDRAEEGRFATVKISPEQGAAGWEDLLGGESYAPILTNAYIFGYNTGSGKPVRNMGEFLDAVGDAKVGIPDAAISPAQTFLYSQWQEEYGDDFMKRLSELDYTTYGSNVPLGQSLAAGEIEYGIGLAPSTLLGLQAEGAPVDYTIPDEANSGVPYNAAILNNAAHPNAAQLFLDWMMSEDGAEQFVANNGPASTPLPVEGSIPWGDLATFAESGWTEEDHENYIATVWTPPFG